MHLWDIRLKKCYGGLIIRSKKCELVDYKLDY